jgi:hypothetical protein
MKLTDIKAVLSFIFGALVSFGIPHIASPTVQSTVIGACALIVSTWIHSKAKNPATKSSTPNILKEMLSQVGGDIKTQIESHLPENPNTTVVGG